MKNEVKIGTFFYPQATHKITEDSQPTSRNNNKVQKELFKCQKSMKGKSLWVQVIRKTLKKEWDE